ncbi:MAG: adenosylhomocysteinase [Candidatus Omnitrophota bacterium]|nr:MAG: adenosylhomocysteinase [Candidatus Omnitrophota bacterium]
MNFEIKNMKLKKEGKKRIEWAKDRMLVLGLIRERFKKEKPLKGINIAACLHITTETASLAITLKEGGAKLRLCASNPLSTQDDVSASLVSDYGIEVFAIRGEDKNTYYKHIKKTLEINPQITLDDGADLVSTIHKSWKGETKNQRLPWAGTEETTTGVIRLRALEREGKLLYPIIAVNDAYTKHLFDNRYGTGQSTLDGILRATNKLIAGTCFLVCGYGFCGRGIALRAKGLGANVIVAEPNPLRALEATMDGYRVLPVKEAVKFADIIVTATGDINVIRREHFLLMKDRAILANSGHFNVEIDIKSLEKLALKKREVKPLVTEYTLRTKEQRSKRTKPKRIYLLGKGRLVNLACAEGHPAEVMDMSFSNQALSCEYIVKNYRDLERKVYRVPQLIDEEVAQLKLKSLGVKTEKLTPQQKKYLKSWEEGT